MELFDEAMRLRDSDPDEAARIWRNLADAGDLDAAYNLSILLADRSPSEAAVWMRPVAAAGDADAALQLAALLEALGRLGDAAAWLQQAAMSDDVMTAAMAAFNLGQLRLRQGDEDDAVCWWRRAAETGCPGPGVAAAYNLGVSAQEHGRDEAEAWWRYAAAAGHYAAALNLAGLPSVLQDEKVEWLLFAMESGDPELTPRAARRLVDVAGQSQRDVTLAALAEIARKAEASGELAQAALVLLGQGILLVAWQHGHEAVAVLRAAADLFASIGDPRGEGGARVELLATLHQQGLEGTQEELVRIAELTAMLAAEEGHDQAAGELNLLAGRLVDELG